ncbi:16S rRNA (cytidine(1402)-2'-O)-methyltransferase [Atribacter laminatus]|jgi:16S rRNA (cytidine1402-2'-O)-methyltransferase|uniref:Ribosomal RNA small subunit methyltransferase I n=1 Tax=Atribacter laminatus TaxID=2847778 RepID=A0A7T1ALX0_ATRLM|nr:16S rRNA (cytidine(1402)-2'-O)-methyltransferase [Atribacter laminatus]QPM68343.1 Ribosomal RNA small subunit methyltransferase I [Atribacter laminatus]
MKEISEWGKFFICPTPIGNLGDITYRTVSIFHQVDLIACEDTRVSRKLLQRYSIQKPLFSYHAHNYQSAIQKILTHLKRRENVALITDAGMPGIQDPGMEIVNQLIHNHINFEVLPGASAVLPAVVYSGFSFNGYLFLGFLPKSGIERKKRLEQLLFSPQAVVLYESPKRILTTLQEIQNLVGEERKAVFCRELTKIHQEIIRGTLKEIIDTLIQRKTVKGEIVLVLEGVSIGEERVLPLVQNCLKQLLFTGHSEKDAVELTSAIFGLKKNRLKLEIKHQKNLFGEKKEKSIF